MLILCRLKARLKRKKQQAIKKKKKEQPITFQYFIAGSAGKKVNVIRRVRFLLYRKSHLKPPDEVLHFWINILSPSLREPRLALYRISRARSRHSLTRIASWLARWNNFHRSKAVSCPSRELRLEDFMRPPTFCSINQDYAAAIKTSRLELQPFISKLAWVTLARRKKEW